jgi:hypothetical protein
VPLDENKGVSRDTSALQCFAAPLGSQRRWRTEALKVSR